LFVVVAAAAGGGSAIGGPPNVDDKMGEDVACGCGDRRWIGRWKTFGGMNSRAATRRGRWC
jgi:hypothetical protein